MNNNIEVNPEHVIESLIRQNAELTHKIAIMEAYIQQLGAEQTSVTELV
jgi:hypothetical protein